VTLGSRGTNRTSWSVSQPPRDGGLMGRAERPRLRARITLVVVLGAALVAVGVALLLSKQSRFAGARSRQIALTSTCCGWSTSSVLWWAPRPA